MPNSMNERYPDHRVMELRALRPNTVDTETCVRRVELMVQTITENKPETIERIANQSSFSYPVDGHDSLWGDGKRSPALSEIEKVYKNIGKNDRVEVLVFNEDNLLKQVIVDEPINDRRRGVVSTSKIEGAYERMCHQLNDYAANIGVEPLNFGELHHVEYIFDETLIERTLDTHNAY